MSNVRQLTKTCSIMSSPGRLRTLERFGKKENCKRLLGYSQARTNWNLNSAQGVATYRSVQIRTIQNNVDVVSSLNWLARAIELIQKDNLKWFEMWNFSGALANRTICILYGEVTTYQALLYDILLLSVSTVSLRYWDNCCKLKQLPRYA